MNIGSNFASQPQSFLPTQKPAEKLPPGVMTEENKTLFDIKSPLDKYAVCSNSNSESIVGKPIDLPKPDDIGKSTSESVKVAIELLKKIFGGAGEFLNTSGANPAAEK